MKKLIIAILLLASFKVNAQVLGNYRIKTRLDSVRYELDYTRYCMFRFHKQMMSGVTMQLLGLTLGGTLGYLSATNEGMKDTGLYGSIAGGIFIIIGTIVQVDSHKWFKKASIGPTNYGIGLSFYIDN